MRIGSAMAAGCWAGTVETVATAAARANRRAYAEWWRVGTLGFVQREPADHLRRRPGTGRATASEAGVAVVHVVVMDAHAVRIGILRRELPDFEHLAVFRIDALDETSGGRHHPEVAPIPLDAMRRVHLDRHHARDAKVVFRIELERQPQAWRDGPQLVGVVRVCGAVRTAPGRFVPLHLLARVHVALHDFAVLPIEGTRERSELC